MMTPTVLRHPASLMVREIEGEMLLLDTASDRVHQLNATASLIWRLHHEGAAPPQIAEALSQDFEVDAGQALADVLETLARLGGLGLLGAPVEDYAQP